MSKKYLSDLVQTIPPSGIRKFFDLVINAGDDVISLGVGEPDFSTPWHIRESAIFALEKGFTSYSENAGLFELREEISKYHHLQTGHKYDPKEEVLVTNGVSEGMDLVFRAILNTGDRVLIPDPGFVCYESLVRLAGGVPVFYDPLNIKELETLEGKFKAIVLNFPGNPIGNIFSQKELELIADFAEKKDMIVLSDEIYAELSFEQKHISFLEIPNMIDRTILFGGVSKSHAMTGFRIGWACGNSAMISAMNKIHQYSAMCASSISQIATIEALRRGEKEVLKMHESYKKRRDFCLLKLKKLKIPCSKAEGAFYLFPDISASGLSDVEFCEKLLSEAKCAIIPGSAFGTKGKSHVRITYAEGMETLEIFFERFEKFWKK